MLCILQTPQYRIGHACTFMQFTVETAEVKKKNTCVGGNKEDNCFSQWSGHVLSMAQVIKGHEMDYLPLAELDGVSACLYL